MPAKSILLRKKFERYLFWGIGVGLLCVSSGLLLGCSSRHSSEATVTLQIPNFNSSSRFIRAATGSTLQINRIMINVTSSDLSHPIVAIWNANSMTALPPSSISVQVPQGSSRLIQALVVLSNTNGSSGQTIDYGDVTQDISGASVNVNVNLQLLTTMSTQGRIMGRYMTAADTGPTGLVHLWITPVTGKPAMLVADMEMIGGYFDFFNPELAANYMTTYKFEDGTTIFNDVTPTSFTGSTYQALISLPAYYQNNQTQQQAPQNIVAGFFPSPLYPIPSTDYLCYNGTTGTTLNNIYSSPGSGSITWSGSSAPTTGQAGVTSGGGGNLDSSTNCNVGGTQTYTTANEFHNLLQFHEQAIGSQNQLLDFSGPYRDIGEMDPSGTGPGQQFATAYYNSINAASAQQMQVDWKYIYGAVSGGYPINGTEVFYRTGTAAMNGDNDIRIDNGFACERLLNRGFTSAGRIAYPGTTATFPLSPADFINSQYQVVLCPYRLTSPYSGFNGSGAFYFHSGAEISPNQGGGNNLPAYHIVWKPDTTAPTGTSANTLSNSTGCTPYNISIEDAAGESVTPATSIPITVSMGGTGLNTSQGLFTGSGCIAGTGVTSLSGLSIPAGTSSTVVWVNVSGASAGSYPITVSSNATMPNGMMPIQAYVDFAVASSSAPTTLTAAPVTMSPWTSPWSQGQSQCYPLDMDLTSSSLPVYSSSPVTFGLNFTGTTSPGVRAYLHYQPDCNDPPINPDGLAPTSQLTIPAGDHTLQLYVQFYDDGGTGTGSTLTVNPTLFTGTLTPGTVSVTP